MAKLTDKQELFCKEYIITLNATQAASKAGYSENTAQQTGSENLSKPLIQERIAELNAERMNELKIDAQYVLNRLHEIDQLDILDIMNDDMSGFRRLSEWPKAWRQSLSGIDINELFDYNEGEKELSGLVKKIKWPDKVKNLELLGKHISVGAFSKEEDKPQDNKPVTLNFFEVTKDNLDRAD